MDKYELIFFNTFMQKFKEPRDTNFGWADPFRSNSSYHSDVTPAERAYIIS